MNRHSAITILRWGLAFVFFYAAVASLLNPQDWVGYLPPLLRNIFPSGILLTGFSIYEIILAVLLFSGKKLYWASILSVITLVGITILNLNQLDVTFRDVGLAMAALALVELVRAQKQDAQE